MSAKHTPGPWTTGREDMQSYDGATGEPFSSVYATDDRAGMHLGTRLPLVIARVNGEHLQRDEEKANARLIAAAPDLLEALRLVEAGEKHCGDCKGAGGFGRYGTDPLCGTCGGAGTTGPAIREAVRAAIAKAEGR